VKKAIGYARVSTSDQAENGVSLEAQESRIRAWCSLNDYDLLYVKVDRGLSGGRADNRPALQEALQAVGRGDALVFYSLTRLARSTKDTLAIADNLDRRGADLVSLSEKIETTTASGKMIFRLLAVLSEFERDVISERTSLSMRYLKGQGRFMGGHTPIGWGKDGDKIVAIEIEQRAVNLAGAMRREGKSLREISAALDGMGMRNRMGKAFAAVQIQRMLQVREFHLGGGTTVT
jgi:site-specific DNA recombinase